MAHEHITHTLWNDTVKVFGFIKTLLLGGLAFGAMGFGIYTFCGYEPDSDSFLHNLTGQNFLNGK